MSAEIALPRAWGPPRLAWPAPSYGTVLLDDAALQAFRQRPLVILSPHFDDACFSLGGFLARVGKGELVNIFTQGDFLGRRATTLTDQQQVYQIRNAEDAAFAARCGLTRHDLGCEEPSLRGRRPHQLGHVGDDINQIARPVRAKLDRLGAGFPDGVRGILLAPLGIGPHVNHHATARVVLGALAALHARYDVYLYEDQPYARSGLHRLGGLWRAGRHAVLGPRYALRTDWAQKKELLQLYPSQQAGRPTRLRFWPRAARPFAPHEAFWSVTPTGKSR